jgi:serine protease Do
MLGIGMGVLALTVLVAGQQPFNSVANQVNRKMVKLFGAGGFKGLPSYGTGVFVSANGFILTVNNHILATSDLRVHLYDGRIHSAKVVAREPELDVALLKITGEVDDLDHFDVDKECARPLAVPGDWVLAFSNQFQIATRDEPMSVQRGVIAAYAELRGRRGIFDPPYNGSVYFLDVIACNPGSAGGIITNRKGELLGILGRELKNVLTDTWINYAVPVQAKVEILRQGKAVTVDIPTFIREGIAGKYQEGEKREFADRGGFHGIVLVPNVVSITPPYIEEVVPGSPAAKAGLRPDDLIVYVDGELVHSVLGFRKLMKHFGPGMDVRMEVQRGMRLESVTLKLVDNPRKKDKGK